MAKSVFKQVVIIFLIIIIACLILAVVFYQYLPNNKVVPAKVSAYATPQNIATEITEGNTAEYKSSEQTYEITDSDLAVYKSKKSYNPGKSDPFDDYNGVDEATSEGESSSSQTNVESTNSKSANVDKNTTDNYYTAAGVGKSTK